MAEIQEKEEALDQEKAKIQQEIKRVHEDAQTQRQDIAKIEKEIQAIQLQIRRPNLEESVLDNLNKERERLLLRVTLREQRIVALLQQLPPLQERLLLIERRIDDKTPHNAPTRGERIINILDPYDDRNLEFRVPSGSQWVILDKATIEKKAGKKIEKLEYFQERWIPVTDNNGRYRVNVELEYRIVCNTRK